MKEAVLFKLSWPRNDPEKVRVWRGGGGGVGRESFPLFFTVKPLHNGHFGDRRKWPMWRGGLYGEVGVKYDNFFGGSTTCVSS